MYGDTSYELIQTGVVAASANTAHAMFPNSEFSAYNDLDVIHLQVQGSANNISIHASISASSQEGIRVATGDNYLDFPPMQVSALEDLHFTNETDGSNGQVRWAAWRRI